MKQQMRRYKRLKVFVVLPEILSTIETAHFQDFNQRLKMIAFPGMSKQTTLVERSNTQKPGMMKEGELKGEDNQEFLNPRYSP